MQRGNHIHHIHYGYGIIEMVLASGECLAYFQRFENIELEPMYQRMEELYGKAFERIPNKGLHVVKQAEFHNCTQTGVF